MAAKEATVYIVDCGRTMGETSHGRKQSNLDWALEYVWDKITSAVATGRKTLLSGVIALRTDQTNNELSDDPSYHHISVLQDLSQILMPNLRKLRNELVVSNTESGDAISALVIAIQMIARTCRKLSYQRKIILVTDAQGPMDADDLSQITSKLKEDSIELVILGVDFDDTEYGFKEEGKNATKAENESVLKTLCEDLSGPFGSLGTFGTIAQAVDELRMPRVKGVRPTPSYKGLLTLGNPEEYETALAIAVERYPKIMQAKPQTASSFVVRGDMSASQATTQASSETMTNGDDGLAAVKNARTYQVDDENAPGGKKDVEFDQLSKGYEYGRTAVHIAESDRIVTTYETIASFDIVGFVDRTQYERYLEMDRTNIIIASRPDRKATMALSALIHALYELDSYAVARFVVKENKEPSIVVLAPCIESDFECLYETALPFAEDIRSYKFPPLDRVVTVSGKTLTMHRNLPSDELQDAMSAYVDSMDLSTFGKGDEGEPAEYAPPDETFSPMLHRINQVIKHRAVYSAEDPPETYDILTRYAHPPAELLKHSQGALDKVIKAADVKKVPQKARGKRFGRKDREADKPLSELDIGALLAKDPKRKTGRINPDNAIPEFIQILEQSTELSAVEDVCNQLKRIVFDWIRHSVGDAKYGQAVEAMRVMREQMDNFERPDLFNDVARELKKKLLEGELGGERREMWHRVRANRLGLIQKREHERSEVSEEEAKEFLRAK